MENIGLLFEKNNSHQYKVDLNKGVLVISIRTTDQDSLVKFFNLFCDNKNLTDMSKISDRPFCGFDIERIINIINSAHKKYGKMKFKIVLDFENIKFIDKLTYIFLECICYYLIKVYSHPVYLSMRVDTEINTVGVNSSPMLLLNSGKKENILKFPQKFCFDIYGKHFRKVIDGKRKRGTNYLGELYKDIDSFLKPFGIDEECRDELSLVIVELADNAGEHSNSECLVDIDVAPEYEKRDSELGISDGNYYYGINIAILNFSNRCLGDDIYENIIQQDYNNMQERYKKVIAAYRKHSQHFSSAYTERDFCNITAFQDKISGRMEQSVTGGTGLTKLIKSLQDKSDTYRCYMITGSNCVNFYKEVLEYDKDGWIGFNQHHDYINDIPEDGVIGEPLIYMPGTAYNFNFVLKGEKIDEYGNSITV